MCRYDENDYVTYTVVISPAQDGIPADTMQVKMNKFKGGSPRDYLKWSFDFQSLAKKKGWNDEQKSRNLIALIEGDLAYDVNLLVIEARTNSWTFDRFFTAVGLLSVPEDFSEDLDNELWNMTKRRDESVLKFSQRFRENIRLFAELPQDAEVIPDVQMRRYFKRGMPISWQDKLAAAGVIPDTLNEMILYFSRLEKQERLHKGPSSQEGHRNKGGRNKDHARKSEHKSPYQPSNKKQGTKYTAKSEGDKWCSHHKTRSHNTSDCFALKKQKEEHSQVEEKVEEINTQ